MNLSNARSVWGERSVQYQAALEVAKSAPQNLLAHTEGEKASHQLNPLTGAFDLAFRPR